MSTDGKIVVICSCGKEYRVDANLAGKTAKCRCGETFLIPPLPEFVAEEVELESTSPPRVPEPTEQIASKLPQATSALFFKIATGVLGVFVVVFAVLWGAGLGSDHVTSVPETVPVKPVSAKTPPKPVRRIDTTRGWRHLELLRERCGPGQWINDLSSELITDFGDDLRYAKITVMPRRNRLLTTLLVDTDGGRFEIISEDTDGTRVVDVLYGSSITLGDDPATANKAVTQVFGSIANAARMPQRSAKRLAVIMEKIPPPFLEIDGSDRAAIALKSIVPFLDQPQIQAIVRREEQHKKRSAEPDYQFTVDDVFRLYFDLGDEWALTLITGRVVAVSGVFNRKAYPYATNCGCAWTAFLDRNKSLRQEDDGWPVISAEKIDKLITKN